MKVLHFVLSAIASLAIVGCAEQSNNSSAQTNDKFFEKLRTERVVSDQNIRWRNIGPGMSGYNEELWTHPTNPDVMFIGPDMHVAYGTWDGAKNWQNIKDYDGLGQEMKRVIDLHFSYQDENYAMALDWNGWVYESKDQGRTWQKLAELSPNYQDVIADPYDPLAFKKGWYDEQIGKRLSELAVDPNNDKVWYVGAGDFWNLKENHRSEKNPEGSKLSYADYGYILKTTDKGKTCKTIGSFAC